VKQNFQRIRLFCNLVGRHPEQKKSLGVRQAWRVAGITAGKIVPMPDEYIEWWWRIQDVMAADVRPEKSKAAAAHAGSNDPAS
jgi:hypothetical protein